MRCQSHFDATHTSERKSEHPPYCFHTLYIHPLSLRFTFLPFAHSLPQWQYLFSLIVTANLLSGLHFPSTCFHATYLYSRSAAFSFLPSARSSPQSQCLFAFIATAHVSSPHSTFPLASPLLSRLLPAFPLHCLLVSPFCPFLSPVAVSLLPYCNCQSSSSRNRFT